MDIESCYQLGYVIRKHGLKGEVYILLDVDDPGYYEEMESVFVAINRQEMLVPFFIEEISIAEDKALVKFEGIDTAEEAENLVSCGLYLPIEFLPRLSEDQFYYHDIIGFQVIDHKAGALGPVQQVYHFTSQDLLSVMHKEKEVLIPVADEIIKKVDKDKKELFVELPDGLLDIYLNG
jgi:16S rRNA processing protein RimM